MLTRDTVSDNREDPFGFHPLNTKSDGSFYSSCSDGQLAFPQGASHSTGRVSPSVALWKTRGPGGDGTHPVSPSFLTNKVKP
jgi:hypothetical protein